MSCLVGSFFLFLCSKTNEKFNYIQIFSWVIVVVTFNRRFLLAILEMLEEVLGMKQ